MVKPEGVSNVFLTFLTMSVGGGVNVNLGEEVPEGGGGGVKPPTPDKSSPVVNHSTRFVVKP